LQNGDRRRLSSQYADFNNPVNPRTHV